MWQTPIYDRTQSDIDNKTSKGYLNISDLNRIEGNIEYIAEIMGVSIQKKEWNILSLPTSADFDRIGNNIAILEDKIVFTTYEDYPDNPINTFQKVNVIESLLMAIKGDYELILGQTTYCGDNEYANSNLL